jgi:hypothetical protein
MLAGAGRLRLANAVLAAFRDGLTDADTVLVVEMSC